MPRTAVIVEVTILDSKRYSRGRLPNPFHRKFDSRVTASYIRKVWRAICLLPATACLAFRPYPESQHLGAETCKKKMSPAWEPVPLHTVNEAHAGFAGWNGLVRSRFAPFRRSAFMGHAETSVGFFPSKKRLAGGQFGLL